MEGKTRARASAGPLTDERRDLAGRYVPLARSLSRRFAGRFPWLRDELESASMLALVTAARSFDPSRETRFATFAQFRIRGELASVVRRAILARIAVVPLDEGEVRARGPGHVAAIIAREQVEHWLRKLPRKAAVVCRLCHVEGLTQSEAAQVLGISQSEACRLLALSRKLLSAQPGAHRAA